MLLRSSSTPIAQTLISDSPTRDFPTATTHHHSLHFTPFSFNSSPISHSTSGYSEFNPKTTNLPRKPFRRTRSDSNLEGLASNPLNLNDLLGREIKSMLHTEPSFSIYTSENGFQENEKLGVGDSLVRSVTSGDNIKGMGSGEFSFGEKGMELIAEEDEEEREKEERERFKNLSIEEEEVAILSSPPMYLATGFGIDGNGIGGNDVDLKATSFDENGDVEEYYKRRVSEDPFNSLFLRNYAQLLQSKGDLPGAEEYYFRATLADPKDGEILMQYAKLLWELHHDQDRALSYFESAARAAPEDSNVLAAYASFLWEIDESDGDSAHDGQNQRSTLVVEKGPVSPSHHLATGLGVADVDGNLEEYYKSMVEENPSNPLFLRNYAQFLCQSKGDLEGAEEYYSRAMLADPGDGEVISQYAQLVWELYHDQDRASSYFECSVQAAPTDSHVLAAYAKFLWEAEDEDDIQLSVLQGATACGSA